MSFINSNEHSNPNNPEDPLSYAPLSVRSEAEPRSNAIPQARSGHLPPTSSLSRFDEIREEAFAKSNRHPLEFQFVHERRPSLVRLAIAGGIAAAIGVTVIVALVFLNMVPKLESNPSEPAISISTASATPTQTTPRDSQVLLQRFLQFQKSQESNNLEHTVSEPASTGSLQKAPEKSHALLEQFIKWQRK